MRFLPIAAVCLFLLAPVSVTGDDAPAKGEPFAVHVIVTAKSVFIFKLNTQTGALWYENQAESKWVKAGEPGELPAGNYALHHQDTGDNLYLFRADRASGKAWFLAGDKMQEVPEIDPAKAPKGNGFVFQLKGHETTKTAFWFYRSDPRTGQAWKMHQLKWQSVGE